MLKTWKNLNRKPLGWSEISIGDIVPVCMSIYHSEMTRHLPAAAVGQAMDVGLTVEKPTAIGRSG